MYSGSSIVDLKAELSRKEELLKTSKGKNVASIDDHKRGKSTFHKIHAMTGKKRKKKDKSKKSVNDDMSNEAELDTETAEQLAKARQKLEAKSKIYDKMKSGEMEDLENIYGETKFLVDFQKKAFDDDKLENNSDDETSKSVKPTSIYEADEEFREKQREKWEAEQKELLDGPIHYENIKFDEIRDLGTGYYAFSKNEEERKKQMEELQKLRNETINIQNKKDLLQQKRKNALQDRLNKIKQRKLGLDVLENDTEDNSKPILNETSSASTSVNDSHEEENSQVDLMLKECRDKSKPKREWDKGKDSAMNFTKQVFVPQKKQKTSVEQFLRERRDERPDEFAPPNLY